MSCQGVEFNGRCFPIYLIEVNWRRKVPEPDPLRNIFDDIRTLVTINEGIATIADERLRKTMFEAVQGAARSLQLPEGMKLGDGLFKPQKAFMAAK